VTWVCCSPPGSYLSPEGPRGRLNGEPLPADGEEVIEPEARDEQLFSELAHELKTPLGVIAGWALFAD